MSSSPDGSILVAGAGIAGLTVAIALARSGFSVRLIERATRFEEIGAGLQLSPNASRVLIGLGLGPAVARRAGVPERLVIGRLASQRRIATMPMNSGDDRFGAPFWTISRADLQTALIDAARGESRIAFLVGRTIDDAQDAPGGVAVNVRTASGTLERIDGAALVGADGQWSRVRRLVGSSQAPRFAGYEAWRALLPVDQAPDRALQRDVRLWMGRDAHLVCYAVAGGRALNVVLVRAAEKPRDESTRDGWSAPGHPADLDELADRMAAPARDLVAAIPAWQVWSLYDLSPLSRWSRGPITLAGDAAHPVPPFLAQGAALAIEDAAVLAQEAARTPRDLAKAFARYETRRRARARRALEASRANARAYHARGLVAFMRDLVIARLGEAGMLKRYQWLYGWTPDQ